MRSVFPRLVVAVAVSVFVLALLLQLVGGAGDLATHLVAVLKSASMPLLAAYAACMLAQSVWRAIRYGVLLRAAGVEPAPGFGHILLVTLSRNMFVDLLPARVGELSYIAMLNRGYHVRGEACVSSLGISVLFDFVALLFIVAGLLLVELFTGPLPVWLLYVTVILAVVVTTGLLLVFRAYGAVLQSVRSVLARLPPGSREAAPPGSHLQSLRLGLCGFLEKIGGAIESTRRAGVLGKTLVLSLLVRVFKYGGYYFCFLAVARAAFPDMAAVPAWKVLLALLSAEAASSAPVPSFMSFGSYESGGTAMWTMLGFPAADSAVCTLALHVCSQIVDYGVGGLALMLFTLLVPGRAVPAPRRRMLAVAAALALAVAAGGFLWYQQRAFTKRGAIEPPASGHDTMIPSTPSFAPGASEGKPDTRHAGPWGFIVWSSNRSGNHDIWKMTLPDRQVSQVTTNPNTEYYPRISPDGRRVAFCRARRPWVSQRDRLPWDICLVDLSSGEDRLVATNGITPVWIDNNRLLFQRDAFFLVEHDLRNGSERVLFTSGQGGIPEGGTLDTPGFNEVAGAAAVTIRGTDRMTALAFTNGTFKRIGGGCQVAWSPDHAFLYLVDQGGHMKNAVWKIDPATGERTLWFDQPGPWSHEYFPKLSADGRWMVFGAATEGHEHDTADYEIFLWEVGSEPASATRLTWHTGNDCWPDVFVDEPVR
ncbi:MAG: lysylphosphatidylglycerol synthase domain-containing protein [bacterium]